jgi:hypothetical protein
MIPVAVFKLLFFVPAGKIKEFSADKLLRGARAAIYKKLILQI